MAIGTVKFFNNSKGFGFIAPNDGAKDIFFHHTAVIMPGFKTLTEGQKVSFNTKQGQRGLEATGVKPE